MLLVLALLLAGSHGQTFANHGCGPGASVAGLLAAAQQLMAEGDFSAATDCLQLAADQDPYHVEVSYVLGHSLAMQRRWDPARKWLQHVLVLDRRHLRARLDLAGVAFEQSRRDEAARLLREVVALDPGNQYALHFLSTVLYLTGRDIEALHYWNRVGAPRVGRIDFSVPSDLEPLILDGLFRFNVGEVLRRDQVIEAKWRQTTLDLGPAFRLELRPAPTDDWNLSVSVPRRSPLPFMRQFLLSNATRVPLTRGFQLSYPSEVGSGKRLSTGLRWSANRRRGTAVLSWPFIAGLSDVLRVGLDVRQERWSLMPSAAPVPLTAVSSSASFRHLLSSRRSIGISAGYESGSLADPDQAGEWPRASRHVLLGLGWTQHFSLNPADTVNVSWTADYSNLLGLPGTEGARQFQSVVDLGWRVSREADLALAIRVGSSSRHLPVTRYFVLGVGEDSPIPLRAHPTLRDGLKGAAPMGRHYLSATTSLGRRVFERKGFALRGFVFSDSAVRWNDLLGTSRTFYQDLGVGLRLGVLGVDLLEIHWGVDVRTSAVRLWLGPAK